MGECRSIIISLPTTVGLIVLPITIVILPIFVGRVTGMSKEVLGTATKWIIKNSSGLKANLQADTNIYPTGIKVSDDESEDIDIERLNPYPQWNYVIHGFKSDRHRPLGAMLRSFNSVTQ